MPAQCLTASGEVDAPTPVSLFHEDDPVCAGFLNREAPSTACLSSAKQSTSLPSLPGYDVLSVISTTKKSRVYRAVREADGKQVALKLMAPGKALQPSNVQRFLRSMKVSHKLKHPNIVKSYASGRYGGLFYVVMEYVDGLPLDRAIQKHGRLTERAVLAVLLSTAKALSYTYRLGIVHRDIKPANILLSKKGEVKLADFGLAKLSAGQEAPTDAFGTTGPLTRELTIIGTPHYMSPEQARGESDLDIRSDIYSLGATAFHMLTGSAPFKGNMLEIITSQIYEPVPLVRMLVPEVSALTNMIVRRMTEKSIERRYQTPMDLAEDVQRAYAELVAKQQVTAKVQCFPSSLSPGETRPDWRAVAERGNAVASDKDSGAMQDSATAKTPVGGVPGTDPTAATTGWVWAKSHTKGRVALLSDAPGQAGTAFTRELCLLTKLANGRSLRIPLVDGEEMYAGRDASTCDIVIEDPTVSSRHCSIVRTGDMVFVQDCGSRNGIRVDGKHVESLTMSEATRRISIGKTSFEIRFGPDRHANDDQYAETPRVLRAVTQPA